jgi:glycosyltransferase involved in cell wall biosynthesis
MKVTIAHISLNSAGGGESLCLSLIKTLRKSGNEVTLATVDKTDWKYLIAIFGEVPFPNHEICLFSSIPKTRFNTLHSFLLVAGYFIELLGLKLLRKEFLISTCGEKINSVADLVYVNGLPLRCTFLLPNINTRRRCFSKLYNSFLRTIDRVNNSVIVANSKFIKDIMSCVKQDVVIIHPPVAVQKFVCTGRKTDRRNLVIVSSRFLPQQNLELVPKLAKLLPKYDFLIIGPSGTNSRQTLEKLEEMINKLEIEDNFKILTNQPSQKFLESLSTAKIFFRTLPHEPFGMAIVEAMAAGCVPIVPRNGGPWVDILDQKQGEYGYSYDSIEEAATLIDKLMKDEGLRREVSARTIKRAMTFESLFFEKKIVDTLNRIYRTKRSA